MANRKSTTTRSPKQKAAAKKVQAIGSQIIKIAKGIQKKSPGKKWVTCMKEAGKVYRSKK